MILLLSEETRDGAPGVSGSLVQGVSVLHIAFDILSLKQERQPAQFSGFRY